VPTTFRRTISTVLFVYFFIFSPVAPFSTAANPARAINKPFRPPQTANAPHRQGELLLRFRTGVSKTDKDAILAMHGVLKRKDLRGDQVLKNWNCRWAATLARRLCKCY
jgi:hypothetical protein